MPESLTPITREETYLAAIAGEEVSVPDPICRKEEFLDAIDTHIGSVEGDVSNVSGAVTALQTQIPASTAGDEGKVLTAGSTAGTASWQTPSGGGGIPYFVTHGTVSGSVGSWEAVLTPDGYSGHVAVSPAYEPGVVGWGCSGGTLTVNGSTFTLPVYWGAPIQSGDYYAAVVIEDNLPTGVTAITLNGSIDDDTGELFIDITVYTESQNEPTASIANCTLYTQSDAVMRYSY